MMNFKLLWCICVPLLFLVACKGSKKSVVDNQVVEVEKANSPLPIDMDLMIKKGACFGRCPVFELNVLANGEMEYKGKRFVEKTGIWKSQLPQDQVVELQNMVLAAEVERLDETYLSGATDMAMHILTVTRPDAVKKIRGDFSLPPEIKAIIAQIDSVANEFEWTQYEAQVPHDAIPGEIIAKLNTDNADQLIEDLSAYGVSLKKRIAPGMPTYLFSTTQDEVSFGRLLILFREHPSVDMAQFNQKVQDRN